jgi:hypothetical protein
MVTFYASKGSMHKRPDLHKSSNTSRHKIEEIEPAIKTDHTKFQNTCRRSAYQRANVSVPVSVKPFSSVGPANTFCCNDPIIENLHCKHHGNKIICHFTISHQPLPFAVRYVVMTETAVLLPHN